MSFLTAVLDPFSGGWVGKKHDWLAKIRDRYFTFVALLAWPGVACNNQERDRHTDESF